MTALRALTDEGRRLVTPELACGGVERWSEDSWRPLVTDCERALALGDLDAAVAHAIAAHAPFDPAMDAALAPALHRALPLTRREAAEPGIWRFLAVIHAPQLVRHRWENLSWATTRLRFWSLGTRHTSNAFARLWWIAELTREGSSYDLTTRALGRQSLATQVFARTWSQHRPAVSAFVDVLRDAPAELVERAARELSRHLAIVPLEYLDERELARIIRVVSPSVSGRA